MARTAKTADKPKTKQDDPAQSKRFIEAAREQGADETEEGARRALKRVLSAPKKSAKR